MATMIQKRNNEVTGNDEFFNIKKGQWQELKAGSFLIDRDGFYHVVESVEVKTFSALSENPSYLSIRECDGDNYFDTLKEAKEFIKSEGGKHVKYISSSF
jgi:hypothetical protein